MPERVETIIKHDVTMKSLLYFENSLKLIWQGHIEIVNALDDIQHRQFSPAKIEHLSVRFNMLGTFSIFQHNIDNGCKRFIYGTWLMGPKA